MKRAGCMGQQNLTCDQQARIYTSSKGHTLFSADILKTSQFVKPEIVRGFTNEQIQCWGHLSFNSPPLHRFSLGPKFLAKQCWVFRNARNCRRLLIRQGQLIGLNSDSILFAIIVPLQCHILASVRRLTRDIAVYTRSSREAHNEIN